VKSRGDKKGEGKQDERRLFRQRAEARGGGEKFYFMVIRFSPNIPILTKHSDEAMREFSENYYYYYYYYYY
jgi:hypothetical protein